MQVSVIGLGYVGLTTAVGLCLKGHRVVGIDNDAEKVRRISNGTPPIFEQGLSEVMSNTSFLATTEYGKALNTSITFLCVPTPCRPDGSLSTDCLKESVERLAKVLEGKEDSHVVVVRSTVAPGTTEEVVIPSIDNVAVCVNPEFSREGKALYDFLNPQRIIIGERDKESGDVLEALYSSFDSPILRTDLRTAEMIKYASNAFLATKISFINEIGNICKQLGIDIHKVAEGMGYDERIGNKFLKAGIGFGGSCLPKDTRALIAKSRAVGYEPKILPQVLELNDEQPSRMLELLKKHLPVKGKTIGILGLAFKPGTDDTRGARAINIVELLLEEGACIRAYDPQAMPNFRRQFPQIEYSSPDEVLRADAILILTEWDEFEKLDYSGKIVIDGRGISAARKARIYEGICW